LVGYIKRCDKLTCFSKDNAKSTLIKHVTHTKKLRALCWLVEMVPKLQDNFTRWVVLVFWGFRMFCVIWNIEETIVEFWDKFDSGL